MKIDPHHTQTSSSEKEEQSSSSEAEEGQLETKLEALNLKENNREEDHPEELLHHIDHFLGVPNDVWIDHLFCFLTTNQLLKVRLITKSLSK